MNKYINCRELLEMLKLAKEDVLQKDIRVEDKLLMLYGLNYAIITIENTLPADVQPVRHGRWILEDDFKIVEQRLRCSKCGWWTINLFVDGSYNYCPECGAKMNGGKS